MCKCKKRCTQNVNLQLTSWTGQGGAVCVCLHGFREKNSVGRSDVAVSLMYTITRLFNWSQLKSIPPLNIPAS